MIKVGEEMKKYIIAFTFFTHKDIDQIIFYNVPEYDLGYYSIAEANTTLSFPRQDDQNTVSKRNSFSFFPQASYEICIYRSPFVFMFTIYLP